MRRPDIYETFKQETNITDEMVLGWKRLTDIYSEAKGSKYSERVIIVHLKGGGTLFYILNEKYTKEEVLADE